MVIGADARAADAGAGEAGAVEGAVAITLVGAGDAEGGDIIPEIRPAPPAKPPVMVLAEGNISATVVRVQAMDSAIGWCQATP